MRWNSLSTRLVATFTILVLAVLAIVTAFSYVRNKIALEEMLENHGRMLLTAMEATTADRIVQHDYVSLRSYVSEMAVKENRVSFAAVANAEGTVVAHSDHAQEGSAMSWPDPGGRDQQARIVERKIQYKKNQVLELTAPIVIAGKRWGTIQLGINYEDVNRVLRRLALGIGLTGMLVLIVSVVCARTFTSRAMSGLTRLVDTTREISGGDLKTRASEEGYDEIRALGYAFNTMAENLRTVLQQIQETGSKVGEFSTGILGVIQDQAASATEQAASVSEVTATMEELSRTSHQIADNSESVKNAAAKTVEMAHHGTVLMRDGVGAMEQIKQRVGEIAKRNLFLGEKSQEIGKVMEIIKEIASEIHLLALNAAIESAAAGEHGRRFSVVASEVRRLAEKTRESTETIRSIISEIQGATGSSIQATDQGMREVDRSRETIKLSSDAFEEIIQMIERTLESSTQISLATHQQTSANEQVVQAMRQLAETVRETATQMRESASSAGELKEMVASLKEKTSVFKV